MFCPQCKAEYRVGFTRCSDCDVELVDHLPIEKLSTAPIRRTFEADRFALEAELVVIRTYQNAIEADLAKSALEAAGIPTILSDSVSRQYISPSLPLQLLVRAEDAEDAEKILDLDVSRADDAQNRSEPL
jgi:Putative prokaryotic signal transducing protein